MGNASCGNVKYADQDLLRAVQDGHELGVLHHILKGCDVNRRSRCHQGLSQTPLMVAASYGQLKCAEMLLDSKADINTIDEYDGDTALSLAVLGSHYKVVQLLLERGAKTGSAYIRRVPLNCAAFRGDNSMVNILLQHSDSEKKEPCLESALVFAARGGHADTVKLLLDSGAEIDHFGENGTALVIAASEGNTAVVSLLLDAGADINFHHKNSCHKAGNTALMGAAYYGHDLVVELLIERGADCNIKNSKGKSVFSFILDPYIRGILNKTDPKRRQLLRDGEPSVGGKERMMPPKDSVEKMRRFNEVNTYRVADQQKRHSVPNIHKIPNVQI